MVSLSPPFPPLNDCRKRRRCASFIVRFSVSGLLSSLSLSFAARKRGLIEQDVAPFVIGFNLLNTLFVAFSLSSPPALNDSASSFHLSNRRQEFSFLERKEGAAAGIESDRKNEKSGGGNFDGLFINFYVDFCFCCSANFPPLFLPPPPLCPIFNLLTCFGGRICCTVCHCAVAAGFVRNSPPSRELRSSQSPRGGV